MERDDSTKTIQQPASQPFPWSRAVWPVVALAVLVVAGFSTTRISISEADQVDPDAFNAADYAADTYSSTVVPYIGENAIELTALLDSLAEGADEAEFGHAPGAASAFSFPVTLTGVAGEVDGNVLPVAVEGVLGNTTVVIQIGPALSGTALRDVSGTISFNEFTNQLEYQKIGTELNNLVRTRVLEPVDFSGVAGRVVEVTGAFTRVNPAFVSVVPTSVTVET